MSRDLVVVPSWLPGSALGDLQRWPRHAVYPVVDASGAPVGVLDLTAVSGGTAPCATVLRDVAVVGADEPLRLPLGGPSASEAPLALVVEDGRMIRVVSEACLLRYERQRLLAGAARGRP